MMPALTKVSQISPHEKALSAGDSGSSEYERLLRKGRYVAYRRFKFGMLSTIRFEFDYGKFVQNSVKKVSRVRSIRDGL